MNPKFKNNKASRSLEAIIAGTDDEKVESGISEMVADSEGEEPESVEDVDDDDEEEPQEITDEDLVEEGSDVDDDDDGEVEEITDAEVKAYQESLACGDGEEEDDDDDDDDDSQDDSSDDSSDDDDDDDSETLDDEPIAEEEVEEITDAEVKAYQESVGCGEGEDCDNDDDDEDPEEQSIEDTMDEENSSEGEDGEDDDEEPVDDEATTEAVARLVKAGFTCSVDGKGKIAVTACGEEVDGCDCEDCDKKKEEEEACVTLRPVAEGEKVDSKEVTAVLHGEDSENPSYTILISGTPVAAIYLQDQPNAEALRGYFLKNEYPRKLISAMAQGGVKEVLDTQHAKMFAAVASKSELAQAMKAEAKAEYDKQLSEAIAGVANKFASAVKLAVAGMNKNFFTEDNNLKAAAYASFTELGCDKAVAYEKVNKVFAEAEGYFDTVVAKAMELMGKSDEAFNEISEMVATAGVANNQTTSFAQKLAEGNNPVIASVQKEEEEVAQASTTAKIKSMRLFR